MATTYLVILSAIVFLPVLGALLVMCVPKEKEEVARYITLGATIGVLALSVLAFLTPLGFGGPFDYQSEAAAHMQYVFNVPWIPSFISSTSWAPTGSACRWSC
jgi:NADH:ubiquinone oxidoreductase subunit 4 (subunit M)